jgi:hypothetical protein
LADLSFGHQGLYATGSGDRPLIKEKQDYDTRLGIQTLKMKNYNSKEEDLEEEDQRQDERNVIL